MVNRARSQTSAVGVRARFAAAGALLLALTACAGPQPEEPEVAATRPPREVRHDTEELARAFPPLGTPVSASWIRWDNSSTGEQSRMQVAWIDAVVEVAPQTMETLVTQYESEESGQRPAVQKELVSVLPPGPFRTGVELNMAFAAERTSTRVFLDPAHDTVVLQSYNFSGR